MKESIPAHANEVFIGGEWQSAADGGVLPLENPSSGEIIGEIAAAQEADIDAAVGAGLGLIWRSPVGPLRLYIAHPLNKSDRDVRVHLQLGADL